MPNPSTYPYRRFPTIQVGAADHAARGTDAVKQELHALCAGGSKTVVTVECYPGTDQAEILALFPHAELVIHADDLAILPAELDAKIEHELTDDPVFGIMTTWQMKDFYPEEALRAVRDGRKFATEADMEESIEVVIAGYQKKNAILTDKEKWTVSYHEIGHALVAAMQTHSAPVQKITIIPRTSGALGYTMQVEQGNHYLMTREELLDQIATYTGGRAAEEVKFGTISTGASNDIEQATKMARAMITRYGMSEDFDMVALETVTNQYLGGDASLACSAETQASIDRQVVALVKKQHEKAKNILTENRQKLDELASYLYEKETITGEEFMKILNG